MLQALKLILEIQQFDMQLIQLMRLKSERVRELDNLKTMVNKLQGQVKQKENDILDLKNAIKLMEGEIAEVITGIKQLEGKQSSVKKLEEFNALTQEMSQKEKERLSKEQRLNDLYERQTDEGDLLKTIKEQLGTSIESGKILEGEIIESISRINEEGHTLKLDRDKLVAKADVDVFAVYERLLRNKKDRVVVSIENRSCSGCHITLTPQDENLVRKGERLVFCEHCSRIHYWPETETLEGTPDAPKQRRRRTSPKATI